MPNGDQPHGRIEKERNEGEGSGGPHLETGEDSGFSPLEAGEGSCRPSSGARKRQRCMSREELAELVKEHTCNWKLIQKEDNSGRRKCRLYQLHPNIKGELSAKKKQTDADLHAKKGNICSYVAFMLPGCTADQIKLYWKSRSRQCDVHPLPSLEGTLSAGIIPQVTSMLPSNQQTGESSHPIEGLIRGMEEHVLLKPHQSLEEALTRQLIHIEQQHLPQSLSMLPSNQQTGESSHSMEGMGDGGGARATGASSASSKFGRSPHSPDHRQLIHIEQYLQSQSLSMFPSNQQTEESSHPVEGLIQWKEEHVLLEQLPPPQSLVEAFTPQADGGITSHQPQLIHIEQQHLQCPFLSMLPSNQQTDRKTAATLIEEHMLLEQLPRPQSLVEALAPEAGGGITSHQRQLIHMEQHPQSQSPSMLPSNQQTRESSHSIIPWTEEEHVQLLVLLEQPSPPQSLEEALFPPGGP